MRHGYSDPIRKGLNPFHGRFLEFSTEMKPSPPPDPSSSSHRTASPRGGGLGGGNSTGPCPPGDSCPYCRQPDASAAISDSRIMIPYHPDYYCRSVYRVPDVGLTGSDAYVGQVTCRNGVTKVSVLEYLPR